MTQSGAKPLVLTVGDPAGVGPEITAKAWASLRSESDLAFAVIAPFDLIARKLNEQNLPSPILISDLSDVDEVFEIGLPVLNMATTDPVKDGKPSAANASTITGSIERGVGHCLAGKADAVVTNPIAKDVLYQSGFKYPGHTEFLGVLTSEHETPYERGPLMMLANDCLLYTSPSPRDA